MTIVKFDYDSRGALRHPDVEADCVPGKGDVVRVSGVRHVVREREFWIDHGRLEYVELHLEELGE